MGWWPGENLQATGGTILLGPHAPSDSYYEELHLYGPSWTTNSTALDWSIIGQPFTIQNWTRVERVWGHTNASTTTLPNLTFQWGVYDEGIWNGTAWVSTLMCATATGLTAASFGNNGTLGGNAAFSTPTLLAPGVYFLAFQISNIVSSGTATAGTSTTLSDSTKAWPNYAGSTVRIVSGTGAGQSRTISSNTTTQLTVSTAWTTIPTTSSVYAIEQTPTGALSGAASTAVPGRSRLLGCREADFASGALPSSLTWRTPGTMASTWNSVALFTLQGSAVT